MLEEGQKSYNFILVKVTDSTLYALYAWNKQKIDSYKIGEIHATKSDGDLTVSGLGPQEKAPKHNINVKNRRIKSFPDDLEIKICINKAEQRFLKLKSKLLNGVYVSKPELI